MREIKFRAWNVIGDRMHYDNDWVYEWSVIKEQHEKGLIIIQQCTGLKDKNGVEIYEGDIVDFGHLNVYGLVKVSDKFSAFVIKYTDIDSESLLGVDMTDSYLVVGNIYENPELLETNKPQ